MYTLFSFFKRFDVIVGTISVFLVPFITLKISHQLKNLYNPHNQVNIHKETKNPIPTSNQLSENLAQLQEKLGCSSDIIIREFMVRSIHKEACLIYIDGLVDTPTIHDHILNPLVHHKLDDCPEQIHLMSSHTKYVLRNYILSVGSLTETDDIENAKHQILMGCVVLIIDEMKEILVMDVKGTKSRTPEEPITEVLVRGSRVGFLENIRDNTAILRSLTTDSHLTFYDYEVGSRTKKKLVLAYIDDIVNDQVLEEVKKRIEQIQAEDILESGYIEQLIEDRYLSPFPQIQSTERPDRVMAALSDGRVGILLDGTPFALIVPVTFSMMLQSPEDYYERWIPMSLIRCLRYIAAFISIFLPALYIAFISFHQGLIPTKLALAIASTRVGVPFPTLIEALLMEVSIELLREAGLRLPQPIGQTVGLVGGIIIGQAAVQASLVSPIMVIVVALTAISSFAIPQYATGFSLRMLRFVAMFFAALLGLYGIILFFLLLSIHFVKLSSFGVPYIAPIVPYTLDDLKDQIFRMPIFTLNHRPKELGAKKLSKKKS